jgi:hypothetical protein
MSDTKYNLMNKFNTYYSLTLLQNDFLLKESIEEILRERTTYETKLNNLKEFWILPSTYFINNLNTFDYKINKSFGSKIDKEINKKFPFFITIISTNYEFIKWLRLRLGSFITLGNFILKDNKFVKKQDIVNDDFFTYTCGIFTTFYIDKSKNDKIINNMILKFYKNYFINNLS